MLINCEHDPVISIPGAKFAVEWPLNQLTQLGWTKVTSPGRCVASEAIGRAGGKVYGFRTGYDVTKWGRRGPVGNPNYTVTPLEDGYAVTTGKGVSMKVRNPRWEWAEGNRGAVGSVAGAGLIDGAFQVISDILFSRECLSPNQIFW